MKRHHVLRILASCGLLGGTVLIIVGGTAGLGTPLVLCGIFLLIAGGMCGMASVFP